jgi:hypothetical protein
LHPLQIQKLDFRRFGRTTVCKDGNAPASEQTCGERCFGAIAAERVAS